jgi:predicted permease
LCGGLFLRSLANANRVDPGFDASGVLLVDLSLDEDASRSGDILPFLDRVQSGIRQIPGVRSQSMSTVVPLALLGREEYRVRTESDPPGVDNRGRWVMANRIAPGYFDTIRIPLLAGRDFTANDRAGAPPVVIVNETLARQFWNGAALGKRLDDAEVVGIVKDSKYWTLGEAIAPTVYTPFAERPVPLFNLLVRSEDPVLATRAIRAELARLDPNVSADVKPMSDAVGAALLPAQVGASTTGTFGVLGALLTMMGIYGLVAFTVAQRTREIGIRRAIGARTPDVFVLVVRGVIVPVAAGLLAGLAIGVLAATALGGFIVGISPIDPPTIAATIVLVVGTALAASIIPALRAARIDALQILKEAG